MADKRPFAKIDTGYILNPKWFKVEQFLRSAMAETLRTAPDVLLANAVRTAREAHLASILYCAQNQTDGMFPVRTIKALTVIQSEAEEAAITALFDAGLWINHKGGLAEVHDYLEHQMSAAQIQQKSNAGRIGAEAKHGKTNANRTDSATGTTDANRSAEKKRKEEILRANFDEWYSHYPKKVGKPSALKAFRTAIKKISLEDLIAATDLYANSVRDVDPKFIKGPGPWLNDERWEASLSTTEAPKQFDPWENIQ